MWMKRVTAREESEQGGGEGGGHGEEAENGGEVFHLLPYSQWAQQLEQSQVNSLS